MVGIRASAQSAHSAHLSEPLVLLDSPGHHLAGACRGKQGGCHRLSGGRERQPGGDLGGVVGAGYVIEQEAAGDDVLLAATAPQVGLDQVAPAVAGP